MDLKLELGIVTGEQKRVLEQYIDPGLFRQRKSYDEYYLYSSLEVFSGGLDDLCVLASEFDVTFGEDYITLT